MVHDLSELSAEVPRVITVDGPSVSSKSSVLKVIESQLGVSYDVQCNIAGDFFRGITAGIYKHVGKKISAVAANANQRDQWIERILEEEDVNHPHRIGLLNTTTIDAHVSKIGASDVSQSAIQEWYNAKAEQAVAAKKDFLILDGRNPRNRIQAHIDRGSLISALDLLLYCKVPVAASRALIRAARHDGQPEPYTFDDDVLAAKEAEIIERRQIDRDRKVFPYKEPDCVVNYRKNVDIGSGLVHRSHGNAVNDVPMTLRVETTDLSLSEQDKLIGGIVTAADAWPEAA